MTEDKLINSRSILFKPNSSLNQEYLTDIYIWELSRLRGTSFLDYNKTPYVYKPSALNYINNLYGTILVRAAVPILNGYLMRYINLDGYITLLKAKAEIISKRICNSSKINEFLTLHTNKYCSPYTENTLKFDSKEQNLYFEGPDKYDYDDGPKSRKISLKNYLLSYLNESD